MNKYVRIGAFLLGATVLAVLIIHSGPATLWHTLRDSIWVVGPLIALWSLVYACNTRAWQLLLPRRPPEFTFWRAYLLSISSFAMNYATPIFSLGGEPLKVSGAAPLLGTHRAVGSVVGFRFLHAISHIIVFLSAIIPAAILLPHTVPIFAILALAALAFSLAATFLLSQHRDGIFERGVALLGRLGPLRRLARRLEENRPRLKELDDELTAIHAAPGQFRWAIATEVTGRILSTFEYTIILYALGLGVDFPRAFVIANISSLFTNLLFFLPFEMGSKEGGVFVVFAWLGFDPKLGTTAALLSRVRELAWTAIGLTALLVAGDVKPGGGDRKP
ncbi:MAG: lysylphosphatidylglycerol synthase transmembrane domain-containing protein [Gemmatimonadales bacterium]